MKLLNFFAILHFWIACIHCKVPNTLRLSQVLFRHGDRTVIDDFPNNPYDDSAWPNGIGQLTQISIRSSATDRTLMSAYTLLAGLYPPEGVQIWDEEINWQPIPVYSKPNDTELYYDVECRLSDLYLQHALESDQAKSFYLQNKDMIDHITKEAGYESVYLQNLWSLFDVLFGITKQNMTLPGWVTPDIYNFLEVFARQELVYLCYYPMQRYIIAGPFLRTLTNKFNAVKDGTMDPDMKLFLYSSHDYIIVPVLSSICRWNNVLPDYSSALIFEMHEMEESQYTIQVFLKNDTIINVFGDPIPIEIKDCGFNCPLEDFLHLLDPLIFNGSYEDWKKLCDKVDE